MYDRSNLSSFIKRDDMGMESQEIDVEMVTLDDFMKFKKADFIRMDVEGYELEVLKGLDLKRFVPKVILVEWHLDFEDINKVLDKTHVYVEQLTKHDYVFVARQ